jgi:hypothetical protein
MTYTSLTNCSDGKFFILILGLSSEICNLLAKASMITAKRYSLCKDQQMNVELKKSGPLYVYNVLVSK